MVECARAPIVAAADRSTALTMAHALLAEAEQQWWLDAQWHDRTTEQTQPEPLGVAATCDVLLELEQVPLAMHACLLLQRCNLGCNRFQLIDAVPADGSDAFHSVESLLATAPAPVRARVTLRSSHEFSVVHFGRTVAYSLEGKRPSECLLYSQYVYLGGVRSVLSCASAQSVVLAVSAAQA